MQESETDRARRTDAPEPQAGASGAVETEARDRLAADATAEHSPETAADHPEDAESIPEDGGPQGPEPTRYGDWERKGRCIDF